jgi:hypothetical protein
LPLAIELAAAQASVLTLPQLADTLRTSLGLLDRGSSRALPRHRRLSDSVEWSLGLLSPEQRRLFARCGALAGAFDPSAAAAVGDLSEPECLPMLLDLADRSVIQASEAGPELRFRLLRPLRAHALRELERTGDSAGTWERLLTWVRALAEDGDHGIRGPGQQRWLHRLDAARAEVENVLQYALRTGAVAEAARIVAALGRYWDWRGRLRDADRWTTAVADADPSRAVPRIGAVLAWQAFVAVEYGEIERGRDGAGRALHLTRQHADVDGELTALATLAMAAGRDEAVISADEMLRLADAVGYRWAQAWSINRRGHLRLELGQIDAAAGDAADSHRRFAELGDDRAQQWATHLEALAAFAGGDSARAGRLAAVVKAGAKGNGDLRTAANAAELLAMTIDDAPERASLQDVVRELRRERTQRKP